MKNELESLIRIRQARERRHAVRLKKEKIDLLDLEKKVAKARQAMEEYSNEIQTLEVDLMSEIIDTQVTAIDIDAIFEKLELAKEKAESLADTYQQAKDQKTVAEENFALSERNLQIVRAAHERMVFLRDDVSSNDSSSEELADSAALEDFRMPGLLI